MRKYAFNEITLLQYIFFIHVLQVGLGVLTMPRELAESAGTDGWISILIGWAIANAASLIIIQVMKRHPEATIIEIVTFYFGRWIGGGITVLIALYFIVAAIIVLFSAISLLKVWVLTHTPTYVIVILLMIPTYLILHSNLRVLGRYNELVFYLSLWMPFLLAMTLRESHLIHLLPVLKDGWMKVLLTAKSTVLSFFGFETAFFLYPFLQKKQAASIGIVIANTLSMLVFLFVTLVAFAYFSPDEITLYTWPTLSLLKVIEIRFLERVDIVFLSVYMFMLSTTWIPYMFFALFSTSQLLGKQDHSGPLKVFACLTIVLSFFFDPSFIQLEAMTKMWSKYGLIFAYAFPLCLWMYAWMHDLFHRRRQTG
ncbi:spore gernimation protein [Brevibacillus choshinensis]|uniref:Spore gernimation protein n=1 Tax=Brevibacillus choshinensis TaxID=54911 RepID=A0ABR5N6H5_BRECH|nr:endospore germination permease [Brevibacillus choshinensis]KQL46200.1 spore gernimation protein [Brevibacillus choshinensis]